MPRVSILMAAYQAEATIEAAVASVLAQDLTDWELIIASDCGRDYLTLLQGWRIVDDRLRMVRTDGIGLGPAAARNAAMAAARGDYLAVLDADDTWRPGRLAALLPLARVAGLVCDNTRAMAPDGWTIATAYPVSDRQWRIDAVDLVRSGVPHFPVLRRELAGAGYRENLRFAEDVAFNIEAIARNGAMTVSGQPLCDYIQWPDSLCNTPDSWRRAEAAYGDIVALIEAENWAVPGGQKAALLAAFTAKRALNRAYGEAVAAGRADSFQQFLADRTSDIAAT